MPKPLKVLLASSEVAPFAQTGGLADVAHALPRALKELNVDVRVVMPKYRGIENNGASPGLVLPELKAQLHDKIYYGAVHEDVFYDAPVPVYFIENNYFYHRSQIYTENGRDYPDNALRYAFFCQAALWLCKGIDWRPDIIHCNDWQTALIPTYLHHLPAFVMDRFFEGIRTVYTIHNLGYQGIITKDWMPRLSLPWETFTPQGLEFFDNINMMKAGIVYSDAITTVSKTYAKEIQTKEFGSGLEGALKHRRNVLTGILNGINDIKWNPKTDKFIRQQYSINSLNKKLLNKTALQRRLKLPERADIPLIGIVSRLAAQKGFDLICSIMNDLMKEDVQIVLLGTGNPDYEAAFLEYQNKWPEKVASHLHFDNPLSHQIEAGSDIFLMPSYYEPCGLNQMYSMRYGTIPIVRKTGGLADTVINAAPKAIDDGRATGFVFSDYTEKALLKTILKALMVYRKKPGAWRKIQKNGMAKDFSWKASAGKYRKLYCELK